MNINIKEIKKIINKVNNNDTIDFFKLFNNWKIDNESPTSDYVCWINSEYFITLCLEDRSIEIFKINNGIGKFVDCIYINKKFTKKIVEKIGDLY